jgi:hypothetical protein
MTHTGPAEIPDIDFRDFVIAPCASYEDTLVLVHGMSREAAIDEIEWAQVAVGAVYRHFGGKDASTPTCEEVDAFIEHRKAMVPYGTLGREKQISSLALRYLSGEGEDYDFVEELAA